MADAISRFGSHKTSCGGSVAGCAPPGSDRDSDEQNRSSFGDVSLTHAHKFPGQLVLQRWARFPSTRDLSLLALEALFVLWRQSPVHLLCRPRPGLCHSGASASVTGQEPFCAVAAGTQVCSCSGGRAQSAALKASAAVSWTISNLLILF